jgi:hypothetical protein
MEQINKIRLCLFINSLLLIIIGFIVTYFAKDSKYFRIGPNKDFIFISILIDTKKKYILLLIIIFFNNFIKVLVEELGEPVLGFNIYNPDKKIISEFTKFQLYYYANFMYFVTNLRTIFNILISITQIDIALYSVFVEQLISSFTIYYLISEKTFIKKNDLILT